MKKNKYNPELLKEEINRFRLLETYDFYHEDKSSPEFKTIDEEDEDPQTDVNVDIDKDVDAQAPAPEGGDDMGNAENDIENELGIADDGSGAPTGDMPAPEAEEVPPAPAPEPVNDDIEVDVTSLVKGSEQATSAANQAAQNSEMLLQKLADMEQRLLGMSVINDKIDNIEHQIIKRIPTPVEKLEMRSMDSYPYNQKLTDYWSEKEGGTAVEPKKKEYVLTQDDIDNSYSESEIQDSFNDYEEEDIY